MEKNQSSNDAVLQKSPSSNDASPQKSPIQHIVMSGGGVFGYVEYGVLKASHKAGLWKHSDLKSMYGTSVGSIFLFIICLAFEWDVLDDYIINRPWHNIFSFDIPTLLQSYEKKGILSMKVIEDICEPLLKAKDLSLQSTLQDLYDVTKIDVHIFTSEMETFELVDLSWKTHPDWKITDCLYSSCCLPILFPPFLKDGKLYIDGGLFNNYPIQICAKHAEHPDTILGIKNKHVHCVIDDKTNLFDYLLTLILSAIQKMSYRYKEEIVTDNILFDTKEKPVFTNEIEIEFPVVSIYDIYLATTNIEERVRLITEGEKNWGDFIEAKERVL